MAIGNSLIQAPAINPFVGTPKGQAMAKPPIAKEPIAAPGAPAAPEGPIANYVDGWRQFIQRVKTEPNLRLGLFQAALSMTQPAATPQESIGRALQIGQGTYQALEDQDYNQGLAEQEMQLRERAQRVDERGAAVGEGELALRGAALEQDRTQTLGNQDIARQELAARLEQIRGDAQYQRDTIALRREELAQGGEQGQVNQRWTRLSDILLRTRPEIFGTGENAQDLARLYAWDLMNSSQGRSEMKTRIMQDGMVFLPQQSEDPAAYNAAFLQLSQQADAILDAAGLSDQRAFSPGAVQQGPAAPGAPASPQTTPLKGGDNVNFNGMRGVVLEVGDSTVVVDFEGTGRQVLDRAAAERMLTRLSVRPVNPNPNAGTIPR